MEDDIAENVLVVVLDTVRAQNTSFGGRDITPTLDRVAGEGTAFKRAITPAPWTLPAHASMYTDRYPSEHGATHQHRWLNDDHVTLAQRLQTAGLSTGLFTPNAFLTGSFNMDRGFESVSFSRGEANMLFPDAFDPVKFLNEREYESGPERIREIVTTLAEGPVLKNVANAAYFKLQETRRGRAAPDTVRWDQNAVEDARAFIRERASRDKRFFAMVNLVQAHAPWSYDPEQLRAVDVEPEDVADTERWQSVASVSEQQWAYAAEDLDFDDTERRILTALYESWIHGVDDLAGDLIDTLHDAGVAEDTLVILTADHGESLAEDGVLGHELTVHERVAHVPLAVSGPDVPDESVETPVSLKDVYGTILAMTGVDGDVGTLFDTGSHSPAYIEVFGVAPGTVDEQYREVAAEYGTQRALFTDDGWAERRRSGNDTAGDTAVLDELDSLVASLDVFRPDSQDEQLEGDVEERLRHLGYRG